MSLVLLERDRRAPRNPDAPFGLLCSPGLRRDEGVWFAGRRVSSSDAGIAHRGTGGERPDPALTRPFGALSAQSGSTGDS